MLVPNLIFCDKQTTVEADLNEGIEAQTKLVFNGGRLVAGLLTAGLGVLCGFLPDAKKKSKSVESAVDLAGLTEVVQGAGGMVG